MFGYLIKCGMKMAVFWVVEPCSLIEVYQRLRGPCCLHHQGFYQTTRRYNPEDSHLRTHPRENLKSYSNVEMFGNTLNKILNSVHCYKLMGERVIS
jgi:hypothetical protein